MTAMIAAAGAAGCDSKSDDDDGQSTPTGQGTPTPNPSASTPTTPSSPAAPTNQNTAPSTPTSSAGTPAGGGATTATGVQTQQGTPPSTGSADGTYFAEVMANGTGCPAGSFKTEISSDKRSFTITFSEYEAQVEPATMVSVKDCNLGLKIKSNKQVAYAVQTFSIDGYAQLEAGVSAKLMAAYYFQGNPAQNATDRVDLTGPYEKEYTFSQNVALPQQVWSECGLERNLNVVSRVRLMNTSPGKKGQLNVAKATGKAKLFVQLNERPCP